MQRKGHVETFVLFNRKPQLKSQQKFVRVKPLPTCIPVSIHALEARFSVFQLAFKLDLHFTVFNISASTSIWKMERNFTAFTLTVWNACVGIYAVITPVKQTQLLQLFHRLFAVCANFFSNLQVLSGYQQLFERSVSLLCKVLNKHKHAF